MSFDVVLVVLGASLLALGLPSSLIKRVWLTVPLLALATGVLLGPSVLDALDPGRLGDEHKALEELARLALAVSLVAAGLQFTREDLRTTWARGTALLTLGMVGMWALTSLGAWLLLDVEPWVALLIGAILTPTDPVVASSLVTGQMAEANLPRRLRRTLQLESGANDGLALVFVLIPALVLTLPGGELPEIAREVGGQVALAVAGGVAFGYVAAKLVDLAEDHRMASHGFFLVSALALALVTVGGVHALGGSGILACFVAGLTFSLTLRDEYADELGQMQQALEHLLVVPVFLFFGAILPWDDWASLGWSGLLFVVWVLVVRRPAPAAAALTIARTPRRERAFLSWYGPVGVAAIYYALFVERYGLPEFERIFAACTLAVAASVVVFSLTATPGVRAFGGRSPLTTLRHPLTEDVEEAP